MIDAELCSKNSDRHPLYTLFEGLNLSRLSVCNADATAMIRGGNNVQKEQDDA